MAKPPSANAGLGGTGVARCLPNPITPAGRVGWGVARHESLSAQTGKRWYDGRSWRETALHHARKLGPTQESQPCHRTAIPLAQVASSALTRRRVQPAPHTGPVFCRHPPGAVPGRGRAEHVGPDRAVAGPADPDPHQGNQATLRPPRRPDHGRQLRPKPAPRHAAPAGKTKAARAEQAAPKLRLAGETAAGSGRYGSQLQFLFAEPEMAALLAAAPAAMRRPLRSLCRMLGVEPPPILALPPRARPKQAQPPQAGPPPTPKRSLRQLANPFRVRYVGGLRDPPPFAKPA